MRKLYYLNAIAATSFKPEGINFRVHHEFELPCVVGDEKGLKELADKNGMDFHFRRYENEIPPRRRVLSKTMDFVDLYETDAFTQKINKALISGNYRMKYIAGCSVRPANCSLIGDDTALSLPDHQPYWKESVSVETKFLRKENSIITIEELINSDVLQQYIKFSYTARANLTKDERDPEDVWTLRFRIPTYGGSDMIYRNIYAQRFKSGAQKLLGATEHKVIVQII